MLLEVRLSAGYQGNSQVLRDFRLSIAPGEIVGLVGQSGSGKSTVALALMRLLEFRGGSARGELRFRGRDLMALREREMRAVRGREIAMVMQSPISALNPAMRIGGQLLESWRAHRPCRSEPGPDLLELLDRVNLPRDPRFLDRYPREISVGQAQRVLIAMAIIHRPSLLIADEPTSALDAVTQAEILKLLARLNRDLGMSILYISHDLQSVASFCHRVAMLHHGSVVDCRTDEFLHNFASIVGTGYVTPEL
ncbi:MAG TPA: ABC transporter ATP-binding protein [Bryobacteraceae bacterium]|nr:ABC transporter ATP-binding protein [Bryobacteraceae bacterium]